jgi:hypothetical protein
MRAKKWTMPNIRDCMKTQMSLYQSYTRQEVTYAVSVVNYVWSTSSKSNYSVFEIEGHSKERSPYISVWNNLGWCWMLERKKIWRMMLLESIFYIIFWCWLPVRWFLQATFFQNLFKSMHFIYKTYFGFNGITQFYSKNLNIQWILEA